MDEQSEKMKEVKEVSGRGTKDMRNMSSSLSTSSEYLVDDLGPLSLTIANVK